MYSALDLYDFDALLTDEQRAVRDTVRRFVTEQVLPGIARHWHDGTFPMETVPQMAELGLFGANIHGYGCAGMDNTAYGVVMRELERGDSGVRSFASVQGALVMYPIYSFGSDAQKDRWLPAMARGEAVGCFGLTEPDKGSNPAGMKTTARWDGADGFVLHGAKMWITNASIAHVAVVWAKVQGGPDDGKIRGFLVERGTKGFETKLTHNKWSLRASLTGEIVLDECRIPASAALPGAGSLRAAFMCLNNARYGICWGAVGAMQAVFDEVLGYVKTRVQFSGPLAKHQLVQWKLANIATELTKAQALCLRLGQLKEAGTLEPHQISLAKRNNVGHALDIARTARDMLGANGILLDYQVGRHLCNLETVNTYEGTHDIHALILGNELTGIAAFD
ncbi:MAG TPA: acyl-CoA dehydrogenase family protein [Myxococcota bacterium]|jgi:glutaryl-CoA dehydrogenase|nr:acyl-CoA dehydrogenase family protein [Myxococcota bacterium]